MKLIPIFILLALSCNSQTCPPGQSYMPSIGYGQTYIDANKCLPDSVVKELWDEYFHAMCLDDTTILAYYTTYRIINFSVYDSTGCNKKTAYQQRINGVWTEISKCLFYWNNKSRLVCWGGRDGLVQVPCCGHFHKVKPK